MVGSDIINYLQQFYEAENETNFLRAIALAYHETAYFDATLEPFRMSELIGHILAYKVAKNENQYQRFVIKDHAGNIIHSYRIEEISVEHPTKDSSYERDKKLMGCILIPEYGENDATEKPVMYICWAGTYSTQTLLADFERSACEESYRRGEDQILAKIIPAINDLAKKTGQSVEIIVTGHSLGAALAQLCYHSLQRILALSIKNKEILKTVRQLENQFKSELDNCAAKFNFSLHQRSLNHLSLATDTVSSMSCDVWNATGVLDPVAKHSNELSRLLVQEVGIFQSGRFGIVGGDIVQTTGQSMILNDVGNNLATVIIFKLEPHTTRMTTSVLGLLGGGFSGAVIGGAIGFPIVGGILLAGVTAAAFFTTKLDAHMMKHFENAYYPQIPFHIYTSRLADGLLNEDKTYGFQKVALELGCKSEVLNIGSKVISDYVPSSSHLRFQSDRQYQQSLFNTALENAEKMDSIKEKDTHIFALLVSQILTNSTGSDERVMKEVIERELINQQDDKRKTLLLYTIDAGRFPLAEKFLTINGIDIDLRDDENNSPILLLMQKLNTIFGSSREAYAFGIRLLEMNVDLSCVNNNKESVTSIFSTWKWGGYLGADFSKLLTQKLADQAEPSYSTRLA